MLLIDFIKREIFMYKLNKKYPLDDPYEDD